MGKTTCSCPHTQSRARRATAAGGELLPRAARLGPGQAGRPPICAKPVPAADACMRREMHDTWGSSCRADQAVLAGEVAWRPAGPCGPAQELPTHHKLAWRVPPPTSNAPPSITSNLQSAGLSCLLIALGMCGVPGEGASRRRGEAHAVARTSMRGQGAQRHERTAKWIQGCNRQSTAAGASAGPRGCPDHPTAAGRVAACLPCMPAPAACLSHTACSMLHEWRADMTLVPLDQTLRQKRGRVLGCAGRGAPPPRPRCAPQHDASPGRRPQRLHSSKGLKSPLTACLHSREGSGSDDEL